jgi:hypothetical protein
MSKYHIPLPTRIKDATIKLKQIGYTVINNDDENFAILAERKKYICNNTNEFFKIAEQLTSDI